MKKVYGEIQTLQIVVRFTSKLPSVASLPSQRHVATCSTEQSLSRASLNQTLWKFQALLFLFKIRCSMGCNFFFFFAIIRIVNVKENKSWNSCIILTPTMEFMGKKTIHGARLRIKQWQLVTSKCAHLLNAFILPATVKANFAKTCQEMSYYFLIFVPWVSAGL